MNRFVSSIVKLFNESPIGITQSGRDDFLYREDVHKLLIRGEMLSGDIDVVIYADSIARWLPPFEEQKIEDQKRQEILRFLCEWLEKKKIKYKVDTSHGGNVSMVQFKPKP